jgi:hypothetical protein
MVIRIVILVFLIHCRPPNFENPCNPKTKQFLIFSFLTLQVSKTSYCNMNPSLQATGNANSALPDLTAFSFKDTINGFSKTYTGIITGNTIDISVPYGKIKTLKASLVTNATSIKSGTLTVTNDLTELDFSVPVLLSLFNSTGQSKDFTINAYALTPVADTNQILCYDNGTNIPCSSGTHPRQDGDFVNSPNAKNIQAISTNPGYANDHINVDLLKGLTWKTCLEGRAGITCTGTTQNPAHANANLACSNLNGLNSGSGYAGLKKWRLPTVNEMIQANEFATNNSMNTFLFPNGIANVWTSNIILPASANALRVGGSIFQDAITVIGANGVRCVNGDPEPLKDLMDNGNLTVLDKRTELTWQKCSNGQASDSACTGTAGGLTWQTVLNDCNTLNLAGKSWRLPNFSELHTLIDTASATAPYLNNTVFPNSPTANMRSSTTNPGGIATDLTVNFQTLSSGGSTGKGNGTGFHARCVSGP